MKKNLEEKFAIIDIILRNLDDCIAEKVDETSTYKKFELNVLKDNTAKMDVIIDQINTLIREKRIGEIDHSKLYLYNNQLEFLSKETEKIAEIVCELYPNSIKIDINTEKEKVNFDFTSNDHWDSLISYLESEFRQE